MSLLRNPWVAALLAWVGGTLLVGGAFALWQVAHHQLIDWSLMKEAALIAAAIAFLNAFRDRRKQQDR